MKILVVGGGGREHTLVWKLNASGRVSKIYCAPGNAGIGEIAENVDIKGDDIEGLYRFALEKKIDLTVVGPEVPLVLGIVDKFNQGGLKIFGPDMKCAQLEGSKSFAKDFMIRHSIPTAKYKEFTELKKAKEAVGLYGFPMVIKADGLAAGKGVVIVNDSQEAIKVLDSIMTDKEFGDAGNKVVIEEFLTGTETSILCFVDGNTIIPMVSAQDYKKAFDDDKGPNTGGMGTYSPSHIYTKELEAEVSAKVLKPVLEGLKKDELDFKGILFIGLMLTHDGAKVLEFNVRFGDPETQVVLPRLETDLVEIMENIIDGKLDKMDIRWNDNKTVCVVLASGGYPGSYPKGKIIDGLDKIDSDVMIFHAGTKTENERIVTSGGRVLGVTAQAKTIEEARKKAYQQAEKIVFEGKQYRKDIAKNK